MTSPTVKIIEFYAQVKHAPPQVGAPYKPQKFYVDVKLEEPATIEDMVDDIVQKLEISTKGNCIKTKRSAGHGKSSFVDYLIEEGLGYVSSGSGDNFLKPYKVQQPTRRTLLYVASDIHLTDYIVLKVIHHMKQ